MKPIQNKPLCLCLGRGHRGAAVAGPTRVPVVAPGAGVVGACGAMQGSAPIAFPIGAYTRGPSPEQRVEGARGSNDRRSRDPG